MEPYGPPVGAPPRGAAPGGRGAGRLTSSDVITSTTPATVSSALADLRIAAAAGSLPSFGRCRRQFHAPSANTATTKTSLTISVMPYGVVQRFDSTWRWRHAVITPNSTTMAPIVSASGEKPFTRSPAGP